MSEFTQKIWTSLVPNANPNTFVGDSGHIFYDPSTGNLRLSDGITPGGIPLLVTGNISGNTGNYSNSNVASYLPTDSTIIGIENSIAGANIAWIANAASQQGQINAFAASNYSNSNVASYLPIYSGNISAGNITAVGNITGNYIFGNGSLLNGLAFNSTILAVNIAIAATNSNVIAANSAILSLQNGLSGANIAWIANAASQQEQINTFLTEIYSNSNVASYLPTDSTIIGIENGLSGANLAIASTNSNVIAANSAILSLQNGLAGANLNIAGANAAIATLQSEVYSNANVASYLPIYTGNIDAGNITVTRNISTGNIIISGTETTAGKSVAISLQSSNYALLSTDFIVVFSASATATLNSALPKGTSYCIKNSYNTTGITNVVPTVGTIEGGPYLLITQPSQSIDITWDGSSNWDIF